MSQIKVCRHEANRLKMLMALNVKKKKNEGQGKVWDASVNSDL